MSAFRALLALRSCRPRFDATTWLRPVLLGLMLACVCLCFFFSSRRRHTRSTRDWSSDVCSSDLDAGRIGVGAQALGVMVAAFEEATRYAQQRHAFGAPLSKIQAVQFKLAEMERDRKSVV